MKIKITTLLLAAALMLAAAIGLTSCGKDYYEEMDEKGYTVSVTFDPNGGTFTSSKATITDVFNPASQPKDTDGNALITLVDPASSIRDKTNPLNVANPGHFLAGWYTERTPIDENDLSKGYTYSGKWDFNNDTLKIDPNKEYTSAESVLTLYAVWIPYFNFEIYTGDELIETVTGLDITIPEWKNGDVTIDMGDFPTVKGSTFVAAYSDPECTSPLTGTIRGEWDVATGSAVNTTIKIYTTWENVERYKIYTAKDLSKNASATGYYEILADLDFTEKGVSWPALFMNTTFNGHFEGNGHTIEGISADGSATRRLNGIFGSIGSEASFSDITFKDVKYTINVGRTQADAYFGLLTGELAEGATFENVELDGTVIIGNSCENLKNSTTSYTINLLAGNLSSTGIEGLTVKSLSAELADPENDSLTFTVGDNYSVVLGFDGAN